MSLLGKFLRGVRILDLSHYLPGPIASLLLGDMGAAVLKVVPPGGDGLQKVGPRDSVGEPIFYSTVNEGKYELTLDLKSDRDKEVLRGLAAVSDVLIEGFRPGTLARLGFAPRELRELNPRLIVCSISSYGATGPLAGAAAHDANLLASGGIMDRNDDCMFDPPVVDCAAALFAALSIAAALHHRAQSGGQGCTIDIGLSDVMMPLQACQIAAHARTGWLPKPRSYYINGGLACYNHYRTADGRRIVLGALEEKFWQSFCLGAGRPDWVARHGEPTPQAGLIEEVAAFFASLTSSECERTFAGIDCCLTPVLDIGQAVNAPQTQHRNLVRAERGSIQALFPAYVDGVAPQSRAALQTVTAEAAQQVFGASRSVN
jgi:alpha-methylacyl-CoA racemase